MSNIVLPEGYQKIWSTMAENDCLDIRVGADILEQGIDRQLNETDRTHGDQVYPKRREEDGRIWVPCLLRASCSRKEVCEGPRQPRATHLLSLEPLKSFVLATALYVSAPVKGYTDEKKISVAKCSSRSWPNSSWRVSRSFVSIHDLSWPYFHHFGQKASTESPGICS